MYADTKKRKCQYTVLLSFAAVYAYASHSRGIVTVIAVTIAVVFLLLLLLLWMDIRKHLRIHLQTEICKPWIYAGTLPADLRFGSNYDACGIHAVSG